MLPKWRSIAESDVKVTLKERSLGGAKDGYEEPVTLKAEDVRRKNQGLPRRL